jgi:hypothetical protein
VWVDTSESSDPSPGATVSSLYPSKGLGVRPLLPVAVAFVVALSAPAAGAPRPAPVLLVADVGEAAQASMPVATWRKLAAEYVGREAIVEDGTSLPDDAHCRNAHAAYAVLATFDRATRLPGLAQDTDRAYAVARFTVRNCLTGEVTATKTVRVESDPLSWADRREDDLARTQTWARVVRRTLAREPLPLGPLSPLETAAPQAAPAPVGRIVRVDGDLVVIQARGLSLNQLLRDVSDAAGKPHAPFDLIVVELAGKYVIAHVFGNHTAHVGDSIEAAK